jgi:hypothetical protein
VKFALQGPHSISQTKKSTLTFLPAYIIHIEGISWNLQSYLGKSGK